MIQLSEEITKIKGGVSSPKGFEAKGVHCGLRYSKKISERLSAKRLQSVRRYIRRAIFRQRR